MASGETDRALMVIVPDTLSSIEQKGEVVPGYYNPGGVFGEVHVVMTNDDRPDVDALQALAGDARLFAHNLPTDPRLFRRSLGWRPRLLRGWAAGAVELARTIRPNLIRAYGVHLNAFAASEVKRALGVPYLVSIHTNPHWDARRHPTKRDDNRRVRLQQWATWSIERVALSHADCVVPVYHYIEEYARRMGARRVEVTYNVVNGASLRPKENYALGNPPRAVLPGNQFLLKDPRPVVEAMRDVPELELTLVGDGPYHDELRSLAGGNGVAERTRFLRAVPNDELCRTLADYDVLISVNDAGGVSKVELEAALTGMPVITNQHPRETEPELLGRHCLAVAGDAPSYAEALRALLGDAALRERLGRGLREAAQVADPGGTAANWAALYRELARPF
jgi:glycosyltransferase involved in cell wall biosynthesis